MQFSPYQLARERRELSLDLPLSAFARLEALVATGGGAVRVEVRFSRDEQGRCRMQGNLRTRQRLRCSNCLEVEAFDMDVVVDACILSSEDAAKELVTEMDPLLLDGSRATPAELFEDDLLLALPERPCGMRTDCPNRPHYAAEPVEPPVRRENPFSVLRKLKDDGDREPDSGR